MLQHIYGTEKKMSLPLQFCEVVFLVGNSTLGQGPSMVIKMQAAFQHLILHLCGQVNLGKEKQQ